MPQKSLGVMFFKAAWYSEEVQPLLMSCVCAGWSARSLARSPLCRIMFVFHFHVQNYQRAAQLRGRRVLCGGIRNEDYYVK